MLVGDGWLAWIEALLLAQNLKVAPEEAARGAVLLAKQLDLSLQALPAGLIVILSGATPPTKNSPHQYPRTVSRGVASDGPLATRSDRCIIR